jgi:3-hydroxyacyl-CoA dehydrogenase
LIEWRKEGSIAVVTIDHPPINAGSHGVREGLLAAIRDISDDASLEGVILVGAGKNFMSGSDIREFGKPLSDPQLPKVIAAIENLRIPVAAAIRGAALGGGYELTLACDLRIADRSAVVGLPEVGLGLVPGAGGTQRLPRLTGVLTALDLVVSARRVKADKALALGMIDAIASGDLISDVKAALRKLDGKRRIAEASVESFDPAEGQRVMEVAVARAKRRPAAVKAAELVLLSAHTPIRQALTLERAAFQDIRVSPEAFAYRYVFFAERDAGRLEMPDIAVPNINRISVIGGGTMGASIAHAFLCAGFQVLLIERDEEALSAGAGRIAALRAEGIAKGRIVDSVAERQAAALDLSTDLGAASNADLVIEAVFEDLSVKRDLLAKLAAVVTPSTLLATNTSYLDIDALAQGLRNPERFLGLHFFAPAHVMRLVEIVRGAGTGQSAMAAALALAKRLGKQPVIAGNAHGFIGNRVYNAYRRHAEFLIQDGATPQAVDRALRDFGMAMGPFEVADLSGLDIAWRMRRAQAATRDPRARYVDIADRLCEAGRLGRKTGAGYYTYVSGRAHPDPATELHINASREAAGITAKAISDDEIRTRCLGAMVNEAALLLSEGVARRASDIDVAMVHGYGFPRWEGGPMWWAAHRSATDRLAMLELLAEGEGPGMRKGDVEAIVACIVPD